jgi:hypothetical protein
MTGRSEHDSGRNDGQGGGGVVSWVSDEAGADAAMLIIGREPVAGYDSEFYGADISEESCVGRSVIDVFSIAIPTAKLNPLGYREPRSWVFDGRLLQHPSVRAYLEDPTKRKVAHNLSVDSHSARNAGVRLRGAQDTLNLARWVYPGRASLPRGNYDLDSLCRWRVGRGKTEDFDEFLGYWVDEPYEELVEKGRCTGCLELGCRKKKEPHGTKVPEWVIVTRTRKVRRHTLLSDIRPGHPLFERYLKYAAADAELALVIWQMMQIDGQKERPFPYDVL